MKVCLITPPSPFLLDQRVFMSLGILKVGAVLKQAGYEVDHLDLTGVANYEDAARDYLGEADCYLVTATTPQLPAALCVQTLLKESHPSARFVIGGPHATLVHAAARKGNVRAMDALSRLVGDFGTVVAGDGEKAVFPALSQKGVIDADNPMCDLWQTSADFEASAWPDRSLVDVGSYHYAVDGRRALSLVSQLGCPFECSFCGGRNSAMLRRIRTRSSTDVVTELSHLHERYGVTGMMFYDDELNVNRGMVDLMRKIKETGIDWRLRGFVKAELFTEEQAEAMYAAGFRWVLCGFEAGHPRILRNINKKATVDDNSRMLRIAHNAGIKVKALMSVGHPGESEETVFATRDWLLAEKPDDFDCTVITVYPGTPYNDSATHLDGNTYVYETHGDRLYFEAIDFATESAFYKGKPGEYHSFVWTDFLDRRRLAQLRDEIEDEVRRKLGIPYPTAAAAIAYEHTMGQILPPYILRSSN